MAWRVDESTFDAGVAEKTERQRACDRVERFCGRKPESVQFLNAGYTLREALCFAKVQMGIGRAVEFILTDGLLVGIPPKTKGRS